MNKKRSWLLCVGCSKQAGRLVLRVVVVVSAPTFVWIICGVVQGWMRHLSKTTTSATPWQTPVWVRTQMSRVSSTKGHDTQKEASILDRLRNESVGLGGVEASNDLRDGKIIKYLDLAFLTPPTSHHPSQPNDDNVINELLFYCSLEFLMFKEQIGNRSRATFS